MSKNFHFGKNFDGKVSFFGMIFDGKFSFLGRVFDNKNFQKRISFLG